MSDYLKSGRESVRLLYILIISLAITESIARLFLKNNVFAMPTSNSLLLAIVFASFIIRFFLYTYRILSFDIDLELQRSKIIIDLIMSFILALAIYIYSLNFQNMFNAQIMIIVICMASFFWLGALAALFKIMSNANSFWIIHDILISILVGFNVLVLNNMVILLIIALVIFCVDFYINYDFYLGLKTNPGLKIFVAGPYSGESKAVITQNVTKAQHIGKLLLLKGHYPFIPHTMIHGWEDDRDIKHEHFEELDHKWLEFCDALYFIGSSPGADKEKEIAVRKGLQIFYNENQVPNAKKNR